MTKEKTAAIVLAAGLGTRMESRLPKVLHRLAGRPMIGHLMETLAGMEFERIVVVVGDDMEAVVDAVAPHRTVVQKDRLGTGHAVRTACEAVDGFDGTVLVLYADAPLISRETLTRALAARRAAPGPAVVVLGFRPSDPGPYGRLIVDADGTLEAIVEAGDATPEQGAIDLCNAGVMAIDSGPLPGLLKRVGRDNAKGEYYLTDIVAMARGDGLTCAVVEGDEAELIGVNSRADLARAEAVVQERLRAAAMAGGASLADPETVYFSHDTRLGRDVTVGPHVVFGPGVAVGDGVEILAFCHIEGARIAAGARIGPFARLRPGADIAAQAHIGNFVEIKNAQVETGAKINHLAYVGDSRVGAKANVGAGTITCNYDGFAKHHTDIGAGAFIGSNTALVAPVTVGDGAIVGAGSVITGDVAADALALTRPDQEELKGWAKRFRGRQSGRKAARPKGGG
ncbi:MAG: bifunctional UDP-N-acetylglucosamine diphosphorylase/glucosamine-1-phosphate N-acetyltransferase GlmU [Rhodospirillales bacterium]